MSPCTTPRGDRVSVGMYVEAPPEIAFDVFTGQIDQWWRHGLRFRVGGRGLSVLHLEPRLGGRMFETISAPDAAAAAPDRRHEHVVQTGTVTGWNPPHALRIEWRGVNFAPHEATTVSVTFEARAGGTQVTLVHSGFASLPADHPVRHGRPVPAFIAQMGMWWSDQLASLRMRLAERAAAPVDPPWLSVARAELGVRTAPVGSGNPRITEYHARTNIAGYDDKANWCSSFVDWSLGQVGIDGSGSALARSWLAWGEALAEPVVGCIAVLWRDDPQTWKGHVGFFLRFEGDDVVLLGGNQLESVCEHRYPRECVLAYRWPASARS